MRTIALSALVGLAACAPGRAPKPTGAVSSHPDGPASPPATTRTSTLAPRPPEPRLALLARVWGETSFTHPYLWEGRSVDWDAATSAAILAVRSAATDDEASD